MTGYGRGEDSAGPFRALVELRSVNHRYAELRFKLPAEAAGLEGTLQKRLAQVVRRGRVDVNVGISRAADDAAPVEINRPMVVSYLKAAELLKDEYRLGGEISVQSVLSLPDVIRVKGGQTGLTSGEQAVVMGAFDRAVSAHDAMRAEEGRILERDIRGRVAAIGKRCARIAKRAPKMVPLYARRLRARLREIDGSAGRGARLYDAKDARLAQEVALVAERSDITEEIVRLEGYLEQLGALLADSPEPPGKKLDFIMQEMNREANTINSKAIDLAICQDALEVKSEVEKIREQVQNVE
ncbi:MAG TPA: YicC/YloC family endoribonuclease [Candidatus Polarisedimenticolia bacterium]|jgi:uncharacterized protein (TIGR00255 family)